MTARLLIPPTATYEEWKAHRAELSRGAVTASEIAVVLGIAPGEWGSPFNLYHLKRGTITSDYDDNAMSLGRHLEPWVADRWAEDHPDLHLADAGLWQSEDRPWQMATPDRLLYKGVPTLAVPPDPDESLLEIKTSGTCDGWGEDGTDQIPPYYRAQVLWQLDTLGLETGHVTCLFLSSRSRRDYVVSFDETDVKFMRDAAQDFLAQVAEGEAPPIDHSPATTRALKQLYPDFDPDAEAEVEADLAEDYRYAKLSLDDAKEQYDLLTNQVRAAMGDARKAVCDGKAVATRQKYEVAEQVRAAYTVDKIVPSRAKKESS